MSGFYSSNSSGRVLLATATPSGTTTFTFSDIPQGYNDLLVVLEGRCATAALFDDIRMRFNGNSGALYDYERAFLRAALTADDGFAQTSAAFGHLAGNTTPTDCAGFLEVIIPNYTRADFFQNWHSKGVNEQAATTTNLFNFTCAGIWKQKAAVTSVTIFTGATSNYSAGTYCRLYGLI